MSFSSRQQWLALALAVALLFVSAAARLLSQTGQGRAARPALAGQGPCGPVKAHPSPSVHHAAFPVDLNRASAAELEAVPGIGPVTAGRILALRAELGRFGSLQELERVKGIKARRLARLAPYLSVGSRPAVRHPGHESVS